MCLGKTSKENCNVLKILEGHTVDEYVTSFL
jgi:hypothetical protein